MRKLIIFAFAMFLSACGTTGPVNVTALKEPIPPGKARILVKRDTSLLYMAAAADIKSNGAKIASLGRGGSVVHTIPAGNNVLSASTMGSFGQFTVTFDAKPRQTYEFEVSPMGGAWLTGSAFGMLGDAVNASISEQSGYFQLELKDIQK